MTHFLFAACQPGAEAALKSDVARRHSDLRFAFSRPGFVTFRLVDDPADASPPALRSTFARTWGYSLGKVVGADPNELARRRLEHWSRGTRAPWLRPSSHTCTCGSATAHCRAMNASIPPPQARAGSRREAARAAAAIRDDPVLERGSTAGDAVLDCVLVEPHEWWVGWHRAESPETRWPGGVPLLTRSGEHDLARVLEDQGSIALVRAADPARATDASRSAALRAGRAQRCSSAAAS